MNKRHFLLAATLVLLLTPNLAFAQDANVFGMAIAAAACGYAQSKAIAAALEGIARNPSAAGAIRGAMIFGLVLIESLAIYALLIAILLIFLLAGNLASV